MEKKKEYRKPGYQFGFADDLPAQADRDMELFPFDNVQELMDTYRNVPAMDCGITRLHTMWEDTQTATPADGDIIAFIREFKEPTGKSYEPTEIEVEQHYGI